jgi:RNA polymerase sigma factor (sigma-70 family)
MVYHTCLRVLRDPELAGDAAQTAFLVLARKAGSVHGNLAAYLHRVAIYSARTLERGERTRKRHEKRAADMALERDQAGRFATTTWDVDALRHLDAAIKGLSKPQRDAILLHYMEGRSCAETAEAMGVAEGTVRSHLNRAMVKLRRRLSRFAPVPSIMVLERFLNERSAEAACPPGIKAAAGQLAEAAHGAGAEMVGSSVVGSAERVIRVMFMEKVRNACAVSVPVLVACVVGAAFSGEPGMPGSPPANAPAGRKPGGTVTREADATVVGTPYETTAPAAGRSVNGLRMSLSTDKAKYEEGEEITFKVVFENVSERALRLGFRDREDLDRRRLLDWGFKGNVTHKHGLSDYLGPPARAGVSPPARTGRLELGKGEERAFTFRTRSAFGQGTFFTWGAARVYRRRWDRVTLRGTGTFRARVVLSIAKKGGARDAWSGKVASNDAAFTIRKPGAQVAGRPVSGLRLLLKAERTKLTWREMGQTSGRPPRTIWGVGAAGIALSIQNVSDKSVRLNRHNAKFEKLHVEVNGPMGIAKSRSGNVPVYQRVARAEHYPSLEPGAEKTLVLGYIGSRQAHPFRVSEPGTYRVKVTYTASAPGDAKAFQKEAWTGTAVSNEVVITVPDRPQK